MPGVRRGRPREIGRRRRAAPHHRRVRGGRPPRETAATALAERESALAERDEAVGQFWAAGVGLADLLLLLFRYTLRHRPDALQALLTEAMRAELEPLARAALGRGVAS